MWVITRLLRYKHPKMSGLDLQVAMSLKVKSNDPVELPVCDFLFNTDACTNSAPSWDINLQNIFDLEFYSTDSTKSQSQM